MADNINHPKHYTWGKVEAIDFIENMDFCSGCAIKYIVRHRHKGTPEEDLKKAKWYIDRLIMQEVSRSEKVVIEKDIDIDTEGLEQMLRNAKPGQIIER